MNIKPAIGQLGNKIRELREAKGLSQREFAEKMDYSTDMISNWERGKNIPSKSSIDRIADTLECSLKEHENLVAVRVTDILKKKG